MSDIGIPRIIGMIICVAMFWWFYPHRSPTDYKVGHYVIRVPAWLGLLCGRPLSGNQVELAAMLGQILYLLVGLIGLSAIWLRLDERQWGILCASGIMTPMMVTLITRLIIVVMYRLGVFRHKSRDR